MKTTPETDRLVLRVLAQGPYAGRSIEEVVLALENPDFLFEGLGSGAFTGDLLGHAGDLASKATRIRMPGAEPGSVVLYYLHPSGRVLAGFAVVTRRQLQQFTPFAVGQSDGLDLSMAKRLAPTDPGAASLLLSAVKFAFWGDPRKSLTAKECSDFFTRSENFV